MLPFRAALSRWYEHLVSTALHRVLPSIVGVIVHCWSRIMHHTAACFTRHSCFTCMHACVHQVCVAPLLSQRAQCDVALSDVHYHDAAARRLTMPTTTVPVGGGRSTRGTAVAAIVGLVVACRPSQPHIVALDEPTNYIDMETLDALVAPKMQAAWSTPAYLPTCLPAYLPTCLPAYLPTCMQAFMCV